jgi:hypothetical protein
MDMHLLHESGKPIYRGCDHGFALSIPPYCQYVEVIVTRPMMTRYVDGNYGSSGYHTPENTVANLNRQNINNMESID